MTLVGLFVVRALGAFIALIAASIGLIAAIRKIRTERKRRALVDSEFSDKFLKQFNDSEINKALSGYIIPHCSPGDPANKEGEGFLADTREPIFDYMDRNIDNVARSYHLLLADTGMGKTTFCLNYFAHGRRRYPSINVCLVSLASKDSDTVIKSIGNKPNTLLIADAFDEDTKGWTRGRDRLSEILELSADFKAVIITCRSQYFTSDDMIPRETPLPVLVPRQLGQSPTFSLIRSYISPFSKQEISRYISRHFPLLYFWKYATRRRARDLVESIPDLAYRPMLLERLPDLASRKSTSTELYDLYDLLVDGWVIRESRWITATDLRRVSVELAIRMYTDFKDTNGRLKPDEIEYVAIRAIGESPDWRHLTARSLLNRDTHGYYKFAHKSILEFLVVKAACEGDDRAVHTPWTPFMKDIFVSWGHTEAGRTRRGRAEEILKSPEGRTNVAPLFDMLGTSAVRGVPDFKRCADRRRTATRDRLAPASWRASSIDVFNAKGRGVTTIRDSEFNLTWIYTRRPKHANYLPVKLVDVLRYVENNPAYRLPSYEQFVALAEGLDCTEGWHGLLPWGSLFVIADKPAKKEYLLVQLKSKITESPHLRLVDKARWISGSSVYINTYLTGVTVSAGHARGLTVEQLYIEDPATD